MITYSKYINNEEHNWYDSSNIIYSTYFDDQLDTTKSIKLVFKGGRTYLYKNVEPQKYMEFRNAQSQGKVFNEYIKTCECVKLPDTNLESLEHMKEEFAELDKLQNNELILKFNEETGELHLFSGNRKIFEGVENKVSIFNLFRAMGIQYIFETTDEHNRSVEDFENSSITI